MRMHRIHIVGIILLVAHTHCLPGTAESIFPEFEEPVRAHVARICDAIQRKQWQRAGRIAADTVPVQLPPPGGVWLSDAIRKDLLDELPGYERDASVPVNAVILHHEDCGNIKQVPDESPRVGDPHTLRHAMRLLDGDEVWVSGGTRLWFNAQSARDLFEDVLAVRFVVLVRVRNRQYGWVDSASRTYRPGSAALDVTVLDFISDDVKAVRTFRYSVSSGKTALLSTKEGAATTDLNTRLQLRAITELYGLIYADG